MRIQRVCVTIWVVAVLFELSSAIGADPIYQWFPANKPESEKKTAWKIAWGYTDPNGTSPESNVLYITGAWFQRAPEEQFVKVLSDLRLSEIYVPYANGGRIYDITGHDFDLIKAEVKGDLGPACIRPGKKIDDFTLLEVHDDAMRWRGEYPVVPLGGPERRLRGQMMTVWATLNAANYRYIVAYSFRDDGSITCRLAATGHNLFHDPERGDAHLHMGCWRIEMDLGDASNNQIAISSVKQLAMDGGAEVKSTEIREETGVTWTPEEFSSIRVTSTTVQNNHEPKNYIGYELISERWGVGRTHGFSTPDGEKFTHSESWVTRARASELSYIDVSRKYATPAESLTRQPVVIWHNSPLNHVPRDEDFGKGNYDTDEGMALAMWGGFTLRPRNFFSQTPLFP